jgi:hypothetical protein
MYRAAMTAFSLVLNTWFIPEWLPQALSEFLGISVCEHCLPLVMNFPRVRIVSDPLDEQMQVIGHEAVCED